MTEPRIWQLEILAVRPAAEDFVWLTIAAPPDWQSRPGQFVNIRCDRPDAPREAADPLDYADDAPRPRAQGAELASRTPLVRRPVSICDLRDRPDGAREIVLLVRVVGAGSRNLAVRRPGDAIDLLGPLGNGFDLDTPARRAFLVGGGCGIAPLVGLARRLAHAGKAVTVFYGCRDSAAVPLTLPPAATPAGADALPPASVAEFPDASVVIATEDGSLGAAGLVTDALAAHADRTGWDDLALFACGPDPMMAALARLARLHRVRRCQVSLENYMGCAVGVCLSCAARVRAAEPPGWTYKLVCRDGPVFDADDVIFQNQWEGCKR